MKKALQALTSLHFVSDITHCTPLATSGYVTFPQLGL